MASSSIKRESSGLFVPNGKGFAELTDQIDDTSVTGVASHLGYNPDQIYNPYIRNKINPDFAVKAVVFEVFTTNIVFVQTAKTELNLKNHKVDFFLRDFDVKREMFGLNAEPLLQAGVDNQTLTIDFLSRVLGFEHESRNGIFLAKGIGYYLFFDGGTLTKFSAADGWNQAAKSWKDNDPDILKKYEQEAAHYWGTNTQAITSEINLQADAWNNTLNSWRNKFVDLHRTEFGTINFVMLGVCHYDKPITLDEFININHGRYQEVDSNSDQRVFTLGKFVYQFLPTGSLSNVKRSNN